MLKCCFHLEKTPSLRIWPDGHFFCLGCHERGHLSQYPELEAKYYSVKSRDPNWANTNQACFPWAGVWVFDMSSDTPRPTGRQANVQLTGCLLLWRNGQPVATRVDGSDGVYVPVFSSQEKLLLWTAEAGIQYDKIKRIDNGTEFLESLGNMHLMFNPHKTPEGKTRWLECRSN